MAEFMIVKPWISENDGIERKIEIITWRHELRDIGKVKQWCGQFRCFCGKTFVTNIHRVRSGMTKSCGCLKSKTRTTLRHGHAINGTLTREYITWSSMVQRCEDPNATKYEEYGGRGIKVCKRWRDDFVAFLNDMGEKPKGHSIERIDVDAGYSKENCRWASGKEQARNKRNTRYLTVGDITKSMPDWADESGVSYKVIERRLILGWPVDKAIFTPLRKSVK